jgi:hypothetical protein
MKRIWIMMLAVAVALVIALPAAGKPGNKPPKPPSEPPVGQTCEEAYSDNPKMQTGIHETGSFFTFTLTRAQHLACYDVTTTLPGNWTVGFVGSAPREMSVMIRDSAPGDFCGTDLNTPETEGLETRSGQDVFDPNPWIFPDIPISGSDACGDGFGDQDDSLTFWANAKSLPRNGDLTITVTVP